MRRATREGLKLPLPRDVEGFSRAVILRLSPSVPMSPPAPPAGVLVPSANDIFRADLTRFIAFTVIYIFFVFGVLSRLALPWGIELALLFALGATWFTLMMRALRRAGKRTLDEIVRGYSTLGSNGTNYFRSSEHSWGEGGAPWDYSGVWRLDRNFAVKSPPNLEIDPPGFYPSPHRAGQWELWTGVVWSGTYRSEPWPRASV